MLSVVDDARVQAQDGHAAWSEAFNELFAQVAGVFGNASVRRHGRGYLLGLLSHQERKNSWWLAEFAGEVSPDGMQRLLNFSPWDEDAARDALARYVVAPDGRSRGRAGGGRDGVPEEGQDVGGRGPDVYRDGGQDRELPGRGVYGLCHPGRGRGRSSTGSCTCRRSGPMTGTRCRKAGIGDGVAFATKPELARKMIGRAVEAGIPFSWVTADEAYGGNTGAAHVAGGAGHRVRDGRLLRCHDPHGGREEAGGQARCPGARAGWQRLSCADGSKGPRLYDWALVGTKSPRHHLLVRRSLAPGEKGDLELAFFRCWSPRPVTLPELVAVAGARWGVEDCFAEAKNETGLDHYQVRKYHAWYRHVTLSMLAHAFLAVTARNSRPATLPPPASRGEDATAKKGT